MNVGKKIPKLYQDDKCFYVFLMPDKAEKNC